MRMFVVFEPRSVNALGQDHVEFIGVEILAETSRTAAGTYVEQRPQKWGEELTLWVLDRLQQGQTGPDTYQVRVSARGLVSFWW